MNIFGWYGVLLYASLIAKAYADERARKKQEEQEQQRDLVINAAVKPPESEWRTISNGRQSLEVKTRLIEHRKTK
jgi:hypothetical protein